MKNLILISTLLAAGTLAANATTTTLDYIKVANVIESTFYEDDNELTLNYSSLNQSSGFYTFETSELDFSNLESATFNIWFYDLSNETDLKIWAVERENTDLNFYIAEEIIKNLDQSSGFVSTSLTTDQLGQMLSIDITNVLKKIAKGKDVAILLGVTTDGAFCCLDYGEGDTTLSLEISAVPEPSMFGLFAGLGALALVATRRRRSRK